ncbi:MAG: T9SS type A sorting domain-containing protein [Bacteroidales bacterium]|nr:T9SS type A sorting domain-containing protein [Bacteroidales bacterium]
MRNILLCTFIVLSAFCFAQTKSILFIGNSYTYYNGGVDVMLKNIALAEGDTLETEAFTVGGAKFSDFCNNPETFERIKSRAWDYVVLQEQSQLPAFPPSQVETECYPFAKQLCDSIRANDSCTQILFFMTWGRENGDQSNCANYPPLCTYDGMQQRLRESYVQMADDNNAIVVPVGLAWKYVRDHYPEIDLYQSDESHPSLEGTYLAACTFNRVLYGTGYYYDNSYCPENLDGNTINKLFSASSNAVNSNWSECNMTESLFVNLEGDFFTKSGFSDRVTAYLTVDFDSCVVECGGVTHTYTQDYYDGISDQGGYKMFYIYLGDFLEEANVNVSLCATVYRDGCSVTTCEKTYYALSGINNAQSDNLSFSNPVTNGKLQFDSDLVGNYEIYSIEGRLLVSGFVSGCEIDVSQLKPGMYLIRIGERTEKFVVGN